MQREAATIRIDHLRTRLFNVDTDQFFLFLLRENFYATMAFSAKASNARPRTRIHAGGIAPGANVDGGAMLIHPVLEVDESAAVASLFYLAG